MREIRLATLVSVAIAVVVLPAACGGGFTAGSPNDGGSDTSTVDAEAGGGEAGVETGPGEGGGGEASVDGPAGHIVYVSNAGSDLFTGLDPAHPKKTISAALVAAKLLPGAAEVHVCKGTYAEDGVSIDFDVALRGAYDCSTWTQTATYGYPHPDGVNATLLLSPDVTLQPSALIVTASVTSATVVDGFDITGVLTASVHTDGVRVTGTASPVLSNDVISGGNGQAAGSNTGSVGVVVDAQAAPEIKDCIIAGGGGTGSVGSTGVFLDTTGSVNLHDSIVTGGTGLASTPAGIAAIGVDVGASLPVAHPLEGVFVNGSDATVTTGETIGVRIDGGGVGAGLVDCDIEGGTGLDATTHSFGVFVDAAGGTVTLLADRVYGGSRPAGTAETYGVFVSAAGSFTVANSMVHGGTVAAGYTVGIDLSGVASPTVVYDTVYTGGEAGTDIALNAGVTGAVISDDLLLGSDVTAGTYGVATSSCGGFIESLDHTAFANLGGLYLCDNGTVNPPTVAFTLATLSTNLGSAESANVVVQSLCATGDTTCAPVTGCPGAPTVCLPAIFGSSWSSDDGISSLFGQTMPDGGVAVNGWTLKPGSACDLTAGGVAITGITTDINGNARAALPTIGATEYPTMPCAKP